MPDSISRHPNAGCGLEWVTTAWMAGPDETSRAIKLTGPIERREILGDLEELIGFVQSLRYAVEEWDKQAPRLA